MVRVDSRSGRGTAETLALEHLFVTDSAPAWLVESNGYRRRLDRSGPEEASVALDGFANTESSCCFVRVPAGTARSVEFTVSDTYRVTACASGGWLLQPEDTTQPTFWIPQPMMVRSLDKDGHILSQQVAELIGFQAAVGSLAVTFGAPAGQVLDWVVWRFPATEPDLVEGLAHPLVLETQPLFMWSSHTLYSRPADIYLHLVHGHVYENHTVWPRYWRVCSELDAYCLFVALNGLERATGKRLYSLFKRQIVLSVIARQADDGGWYQGEWTDRMEAHYRLHGGAMHLLASALAEWPDDTATGAALTKAAGYIVGRSAKIESGTWFLHDSLEGSPESISLYPFRWVRSTAFGKSPDNMLVLNTHLDTMLALHRYAEVTGDGQYRSALESARSTTRTVLARRPAEWLYRPLFKAIGLTFLPTVEASRLPLPVRAVKRIAWKYLIPWLPRIKAVFPRLVMPGGHIERALSQCSWSDQYQSVTLMDLLRYRRRFAGDDLGTAMDEALAFTQSSGIRMRWKESRENGHALGFWAEALYHLCTQSSDPLYRQWLAEVIQDVEDRGLGLSPSLLGANSEVVEGAAQLACPSPSDPALRVVNLGREEATELLVVNPTSDDLPLAWESAPGHPLAWTSSAAGAKLEASVVPARGWVWGVENRESTVTEIRASAVG